MTVGTLTLFFSPHAYQHADGRVEMLPATTKGRTLTHAVMEVNEAKRIWRRMDAPAVIELLIRSTLVEAVRGAQNEEIREFRIGKEAVWLRVVREEWPGAMSASML